MKIAVEGCCHGELDKIYDTIKYLEQRENIKIDLLLICGDFQSVRNRSDLDCMAVPKKYQKLNTFYKYYSGEKEAPVLTIFVGGNHEASNYLQELPYGGYVAPKIYYLGYAGVVNFRGLRIAGVSGIFKGRDYNTGHHERLPYDNDSKRSVYHVRNLEIFRLKQLKEPVDIMLSHDWPSNITDYGNTTALLRKKPFLREDIESRKLGCPPTAELLDHMKPKYWFAAHLHTKFSAVVKHESLNGEEKLTKFLSLDKCLPKRDFLQVLDMPDPEPGTSPHLELDPEWLVILKTTNHLLSLKRSRIFMPGFGCGERYDFTVKESDLKSLKEDLGGMYEIPRNFERTAPVHDPNSPPPPLQLYTHPWTRLLCEVLGITDPNSVFKGIRSEGNSSPGNTSLDDNEDSIISDEEVSDTSHSYISDTSYSFSNTSVSTNLSVTQNPAEISIESSDSDSEPDPRANLSQLSEIGNSSFSEAGDVPSKSHLGDRLDSSQSDDKLDSSQSEGLENSQSESEGPSCNSDQPQPKKFKRRNQSIYSSSD